MPSIALWISKAGLILAAATTAAVGTFPVQASAANVAATPTASAPATKNDRLERAWAREQQAYERVGQFFDRSDDRIAEAQQLIDKAKANGKDVTALQAALDAFAAAVKQARPVYEGGKGIVASHQGFDASGHVTDADKARQTVIEMGNKLKEVRQLIEPSARALREAVRAFRQANHPTGTATPTQP
jgi:hypothetical protein